VGGVTGYTVYYATPGGSWTLLIKNLAPGQTSLPVTVPPGATYLFDVCASNSAGWTYANPITVTAQAGLPSPPTIFSVQKVSSTQVLLSWNAVGGATSYVTYVQTSSGWQKITNGSTTSTSLYVNVTAGYTYTFDVAAVGASGGTSQGAPPASITV
jgi:hypothetical protein